jgi:hypothetical protein
MMGKGAPPVQDHAANLARYQTENMKCASNLADFSSWHAIADYDGLARRPDQGRA